MRRLGKLLACGVMWFALAVSSGLAAEVVVPARSHTAKHGNVNPSDMGWDGLVVVDGVGGMQQWDIDLKDARKYFLHFEYASGEPRPVNLFINDKQQEGEYLKRVTGGFFARNLHWDTYGPFDFLQGKNTIRIETMGASPHLAGFVVSDEKKVPDKNAFAKLFPTKREAVTPPVVVAVDADAAATRTRLRELLPGVDEILFVRRATMQSSHYYTDFIDGCQDFGSNLCVLSLTDGVLRELAPALAHGLIGRCCLSFDGKRVAFDWKEKPGVGFRIWEVGIDGHGLRQLTFPPDDEAARIKKYGLGNSGYRHQTDDLHPCYLPDGGICFVSSRCEYGILCDAADQLTTTLLYRMDADGNHMEPLSNNSVSESVPSLMNDGRILYTRWEYVDNGSVTNKALWAMRPDGTGSEEVYGRNIAFPSVFNVGRAVPGFSDRFVAIGAPHMPLGVGTLMLIDTRFDRRTGMPVTYLTPEVDSRHQSGWDTVPGGATKPIPPAEQGGRDGGGNTDRGPLYMDPYPLSLAQHLVAFNPAERWNVKNAWGRYLIDGDGPRRLLHKEAATSCWNPIPVRARATPPVLRGVIEKDLAKRGLARLIITDVYGGMDGVKRGTIKFLRVNEHVPRPWAARRFWDGDCYDQQHSVISRDAALGLRIQHGIVPVEDDGSAHLLVQADKNIFFQALDKDYMEVQRERTFVNYRPGETRSCIGCHEQAQNAGNSLFKQPVVAALRREASLPGPQPGETSGARPLSYAEDVQPVWDTHCVSCHGGAKTEGKLDLSGKLTTLFNRSYDEIMQRRLIPIIGENHPKAGNNHYLPPYSLGSHASKLQEFLKPEHYQVNLSPAERIRVTTWIDSNGQYYGTYFGHKNLQYKDQADFRQVLTFEQAHANVAPVAADKPPVR